MQRGFSLVELSIVLVILGLLTGGILSGQSLIRAAEVRTVGSDLARYQAAAYSFRDKYFALPGDMTNAQSFWGVRAAGTNLVCQQTVNVTTGTCNSDGNGQMDRLAGDAGYNERFLVWQHLAYAGLIEGSYTGASAVATVQTSVSGTNTPATKLDGLWTPFYLGGPLSGHAEWYDGAYSINGLAFGRASSASSPPFKPEELWNIDTKLDDGRPATGRVFATKGSGSWAAGCTTGDTLAAEYSLSSSAKLCLMWARFI